MFESLHFKKKTYSYVFYINRVFYTPTVSFCWQMFPNEHSFLKIPQHATFTAVLTSDGGVCESWQSCERLRLVWGSRRAES